MTETRTCLLGLVKTSALELGFPVSPLLRTVLWILWNRCEILWICVCMLDTLKYLLYDAIRLLEANSHTSLVNIQTAPKQSQLADRAPPFRQELSSQVLSNKGIDPMMSHRFKHPNRFMSQSSTSLKSSLNKLLNARRLKRWIHGMYIFWKS